MIRLLMLNAITQSHGDTVTIRKGVLHAICASEELTFIEVQSGNVLDESDIERFDWDWETTL